MSVRTTSRPGNIDHSAHLHPDTSHWKQQCRKSILAGNGPIREPGSSGMVAISEALLRKEAEASTRLDGETHAVDATPDVFGEGELPPGYALVPVERPAVIVRLGIIQELDAMLADLDPILDGFAVTKSAVIRFDKDGQELAAVWNGEAWAVEVR